MEIFTGFSSEVALRFSDLDAMRHVNNARFLTLTEDARRDWISLPVFKGTGIGAVAFIMAHAEIDFLHAVMPPEWKVRIATAVAAIGSSSFSIRHTLHHNETHVATVQLVMVAFDYEQQVKRQLDALEKAALEKFSLQANSPGAGSTTTTGTPA